MTRKRSRRSVAVRCCLLPWSATACGCWVTVFSWCIVVYAYGSLVHVSDDGHVVCCASFIVVLTHFRDFWELPTIGIELVGTNDRVSALQSAQWRLSSKLTEDHFVTVVSQIQASLEFPHYPQRQWWWEILLHNSEPDDTFAPSQTNWHIYNADWLRHASNAACGFQLLLAPLDLETVFREQFTPIVKLLLPGDSLLGTSVPQDFSRVKSDECAGSAEKERSSSRRLCDSDEPFLIFPQVTLHVDSTFRRCVVLESRRDTREASVQV